MTKSKKHWQKEKLLVLSNFFFCHYVFKKLSAAEVSESVYMRERVKQTSIEVFSFCLNVFKAVSCRFVVCSR